MQAGVVKLDRDWSEAMVQRIDLVRLLLYPGMEIFKPSELVMVVMATSAYLKLKRCKLDYVKTSRLHQLYIMHHVIHFHSYPLSNDAFRNILTIVSARDQLLISCKAAFYPVLNHEFDFRNLESFSLTSWISKQRPQRHGGLQLGC